MTEHALPAWTLTTPEGAAGLPAFSDATMTGESLAALREVLAMASQAPLITLETRPLPRSSRPRPSRWLAADSPLARELTEFLRKAAVAAPHEPTAPTSGHSETLYRVAVPQNLAKQLADGTARLMPAHEGAGAVHSAVQSGGKIVDQAAFEPVDLLTQGAAVSPRAVVATPQFLVAAVAVALVVRSEQRHAEIVDMIAGIRDQLTDQDLQQRNRALEGCKSSVGKAATVLLDEGRLGNSLGIDSAANTIDTAVAAAEQDISRWTAALDALPESAPVPQRALGTEFTGWDADGGEFHQRVRLAALAIALKRRILLVQAVDHAQSDRGNPYRALVAALRREAEDVAALEERLSQVLQRLSAVELCAPTELLDTVMSRREVNALLRASYRLRDIETALPRQEQGPLTMDVVRHDDGRLEILAAAAPALAAAESNPGS